MREGHSIYERGVTLVELLITLTALAIVVVSIPMSFRSGTQVWERGDRHAEVLQNALIGMEEMTRNLKQAQGITNVSSGYIEFKNSDGDDSSYGYGEYLQADSQPLAGPVDSLMFTCYEKDGVTETTTPDDITSVRIQLITSDSQGKVNPIPLSSRVHIRDLAVRSYRATDFAIFGQSGVELLQNVTVGGTEHPSNIGSNGNIYYGNNTWVDPESETIHLGELEFQNPDHVVMGSDYVGYIELPCPTDFSAGGADIESRPSDPDTIPLEPGSYGYLDLANGKTLNLSSGNYYFESITAGNGLNLNIDLSSGDINIFVEGRADIGNNLTLSITGGGPEQVYAETHYVSDPADPGDLAWGMGMNTDWRGGTIYAPYGHIDVVDGVIVGALYSGGYVTIHNVSAIDYVPSNYLLSRPYDCN